MCGRRNFLKLTSKCLSAILAFPYLKGCASPRNLNRTVVNDVHSQINATRVLHIRTPTSTSDLNRILSSSFKAKRKISICGSRHSMGGQQFGTDTDLIDLRSLNRVIGIDRSRKIVEVEAGITWPTLINWLNEAAPELSIIQKQTGADELTIGGALASNIHGRGLSQKPIIDDVESFTIITAKDGRLECSRLQNRELFGLAIGGYGLFGIIDTVRLRLTKRIKVERVVETKPVNELIPAIHQRISEGFLFGDLQYMTDENAEGFMREGIFSCYKPAAKDAHVPTGKTDLTLENWQALYLLAHVDKPKAFQMYRDHYLQTDGQIYWSDHHQLSTYLENQNQILNKTLGSTVASSLMISELYVPPEKLSIFMESARNAALENQMDIIYGTIRFIQKDTESYLAWAKEDYVCIIFNLHIIHTPEGIAKAKTDFRRLIDEALNLGGSYYLTYHRWARKDQVLSAYPQFEDFLNKKKDYDPEERFTSEWYRHYKEMFRII